MSSITGEINELNSIKHEIKRVSGLLRDLRTKQKILEEKISKFINKQDKPGIKYKGNQFNPETKQVIDRKRSKKNKEQDARDVLEGYGISTENSETIVKEMLEAMRGERIETTALKIKPLK